MLERFQIHSYPRPKQNDRKNISAQTTRARAYKQIFLSKWLPKI